MGVLTQEDIFGYVDLRKKWVSYPSVMSFEDQSASESQKICDLCGIYRANVCG
jgi:hypothetical protein